MTDEQIDDLKQYLSTTISQATADMATKDDMANLRSHIDSRFSELQELIAESSSIANDSVDQQIHAHELRITKLERLTNHHLA